MQPFLKHVVDTSEEEGADRSPRQGLPLSYFNTNTFCAPTVFAAQLSLHEKEMRGEYVVIGADDFAAAVMAPVAAVGDALFWSGLRPLAVLMAIILALLGFICAPLAILVLFTLPTGIVRLGGSLLGYVRGAQVVALIQQFHLANLAVRIKQVNVLLLGVTSALVWRGLDSELSLVDIPSMYLAALVLLLVGVNVFLLRCRFPVVVVLGVTLIAFCSAGYIP